MSKTGANTSKSKRSPGRPIGITRFEKTAGLEMKGDRLVVRLSRDSHPELYDIDKTIRNIRKLIDTYDKKTRMRDLTEFLAETERGLQIILRNHLELAMRKYLGDRPI